MMNLLVLIKKFNSKLSDDFVGTFSNPGDPPSQWDLLKRNKELQTMGLKFKIVEVKDLIPDEYKDLSFPGLQYINHEGTIVTFKNRNLEVSEIVNWIINRNEAPVIKIQEDEEPPILMDTSTTIFKKEPIEKITEIVNKTKPPPKNFISAMIDEHPWASYGVGLAFCASAILGVIGGSYLADRYNSRADETQPLLLVNDEGKPVNFQWEESETFVSRDLIIQENSIENVTAKNKNKETEDGLIEIPLQNDI